MQIDITPAELETILSALDWYEDDRRECARHERSEADAEEQESAADEARTLLEKLSSYQEQK